MTITVQAFTGSESVGTTEHSMTTDTPGPDADTSSGVFQAFLDLNALASSDEYEFKVYESVRNGDPQRAVYAARFAGAQGTPVWASPTLILGVGWDMTLRKIAGTDRTLTWRISKVA